MVDVRLSFPVGGEYRPRIDNVSLILQRQPTIMPIVGDTDTGDARFLWVDLGLGSLQLRLQGAMRIGDIDMKGLELAFVRSWRAAQADTSDNVDRSRIVLAALHDPRIGMEREFYCLPRRFERSATGGASAWYYRIDLEVVIPPFSSAPLSFRADRLPGERVALEFPVGYTWVPADKAVIAVNRNPAVVSLVGDTDSGAPNFFFTDLGLAEVDLQIAGVFPDAVDPDPFDVFSAMLSSWRYARAGDNMRGGEIGRVVRVYLDSPDGTLIYRTIPRGMTLTRVGQTARWEHRIELSVVELNG